MTVEILHIDLQSRGQDEVELRFFWDNPSQFAPQYRSLSDLQQQIRLAETLYYDDDGRTPKNYAQLGQDLLAWLDGSERRLLQALANHTHSLVALAISTSESLSHLPWEVLHDGQQFLVQRHPPLVPLRWLKEERSSPLRQPLQPQNRALQVLFMATSPLGIRPVLAFEAEEAAILEATKRRAYLRVEESGCLKELREVVQEYGPGYFDVFHLSGHAGWGEDQPYFWTESEYGDPESSGVGELAQALTYQPPPLLFLSGCWTGYGQAGRAIPSLAQQMLERGASAVLGWRNPVSDSGATGGAAILYRELAAGASLVEALGETYQGLIRAQSPDWHRLRLYVRESLPGALVTPVRTPKRKGVPAQVPSSEAFRDHQGRLRVVSRAAFVGRRRQIQNCLRTLKADPDKVGVVIHGMGGLGKSTIASRLWDRLAEFEKVCWWRQIDEAGLVRELCFKLNKPEQQGWVEYLQDRGVRLVSRLSHVFREEWEAGEKPLLLVMDDFEWNLEPRQGGYVLKAEVAEVLEAVVRGIRETGTGHRLLITCRYEFESPLSEGFYWQGLERLHGADLEKKLRQLERFTGEEKDGEVCERALKLADGNPRLLEWLDQEVLGEPDVGERLEQLERSAESWKEKIIWPELYEQIDERLQEVLSRCLIYELPVPMRALEGVCVGIPEAREELERGLGLGLLEVSSGVKEEERVYRVSRVLPHLMSGVGLPQDLSELSGLYRRAWEGVEALWGQRDNKDPEQWRELYRLWFGDRRDPERFREGFSRMISIQEHRESDKALEEALRQWAGEWVSEGLCRRLEEHLGRGEWKAADEETAWIFYQVMVREGIEDWGELMKRLPLSLLKEMDRLWSEGSEGRFGFRAQKEIFLQVGGRPGGDYDLKVWEKFGDAVQWQQQGEWLEYSELSWEKEVIQRASRGHLPLLCLLRYPTVGCGWGWWGRFLSSWGGSLSSLVETYRD